MGKNKKAAEPEPVETMRRQYLFAFVLLGVSSLLAYSSSLNGTWALDDIFVNKTVGLKDLRDLIGFRMVAYVSFLLNQWIAPFSPLNFRLFNIFIHFVNAVLVYLLAQKTLQLGGLTDKNKVSLAALFSGLIFALHPLNINAVAYIIQRMTSLAALFVLLALFCYILAAQAKHSMRALLFYVLSVIFIILGIFSKENAVMAFPLIILYDYVFLTKFSHKVMAKKVLLIVGAGIISLGLSAYFLGFHHSFIELLKLFGSPNLPLKGTGWMAVDVFWTPLQHILTELRVVSRYLFLVVVPLPGFLVFDWWGYPVSTGLLSPLTTLLSLVFLAALMLFSLWKLKKIPLLCFGILWYLLAISLESFFALGSDFYYEHRNYLPLTGLIIGVTGQSMVLLKDRVKGKVALAVVSVFCILLGSMTFARNFVWKDSLTLWGDTLTKNPANIRVMIAMGNSYLNLSDMANAEKYFKEAVKVSSKNSRLRYLSDAAYSLGMIYLYEGKLRQAKELIALFDDTFESYRPRILRGFYKTKSNDVDGALKDYEEALASAADLDTVVVHTLMGDAYRTKGLWASAREHYNKAITMDPGFASAYYGMGVAYMGQRNLALAQDYFSKVLEIEPENVQALSDMADLILIGHKDPAKALNYAQRAVSKAPSFHQPYMTMGNVLIVLGRENEAGEFYKKAVEREMPEYMVPFSMARAYYIKGDKEKAEYYLARLRGYKDLPENIKNMIH